MVARGMPSNSEDSLRVKVYRLIGADKWDDQGTGHVRVDYLEGSEDPSLIVDDEDENGRLLVHRISSSDIYRRQEDTIISWSDSELAKDLALSFQEATGCSVIWDQICEVQKNLHFSSLADNSFHAVNNELRDLPSVELSSLPLILKTVVECGISDQLRVAEFILQDQEFFPKLIELFRMCEDLENLDGLYMIFRLVKAVLFLNNPQIFDRIFGEEYILDFIGSLEFVRLVNLVEALANQCADLVKKIGPFDDPELPQVQQHRAYLKEHVVFKEAIPIKDSSVLSKIHQTYRVAYIKDVILPRVLDEATIASLNSIIHANNALVISLLKDDSSFIQELFTRMRSTTTSADTKKELVLFLHEFCTLSKSLPLVQQLRLFRDLAAEGMFDITTDVLQSQDRKLVSAGTDILVLSLNIDPNLLRSYVVQQEANSLLGILVKGLITEFIDDMHCQFLEIIRILVDLENVSGSQKDTIVDIFYEKHLNQLMDVIVFSCSPRNKSPTTFSSLAFGERVKANTVAKPETLSNICDLLCYCVIHHPYKIKCNFLMNNGMEKVLALTHRRERYLVVAAVRFIRTIIARNDEHLLCHIVKNNVLKPIIEVFIRNGDRYNMLQSGVLELFEYIRKENIKTLVMYVIDCFWEQLLKFKYLATIHALKIKYEQYMEKSEANNINTMSDLRKRAEDRTIEREEEDYFNEDSDEESGQQDTCNQNARTKMPNGTKINNSSLRSGSVGLVDYEDDDDDEDYNPPPRKTNASTQDDDDDDDVGFLKIKRKSSTISSIKNDKLLAIKKRKMEIRINDDSEATIMALTSNNHVLTCKRELFEDSSLQLDTNGHLGEMNIENKSTNPKMDNHIVDASDIRQSSREGCQSAPSNNPSLEKVVNSKNITASEPLIV